MSIGSTLAAAALCCGLASAQEGRKLTAAPDRRVELDLQHYYSARELQVALNALSSAYPEFFRLESIGRSRAGQELWAITVASRDGLEAKQRPALLLVGSLGREDAFGAELALATLLEIAQNHARDPALERALDEATLYVVPSVNPDLRERAFAELEGRAPSASANGEFGDKAAAELDHNFPMLWDPLKNAHAGPYPLCEPESRALAELILARPNIAIVERYGTGTPRTLGTTREWPAGDRELHRRIAAESLLEGLEALDGRDGGLLAFAYGQHGAFVFSQPVSFASSGAWALPGVLEIQALGRSVAPATLRLAYALPRLELTQGAVEALGDERWSVDLQVANRGRLPTSSALGRERSACGLPSVTIAGAKIVGAALVQPDGGVATLAHRDGVVTLPDIAGGAVTVVRLFLAAPLETQAALSVSAPRAGAISVSIVLR